MGIVFFFFIEKFLTLAGEWRRRRERKKKVIYPLWQGEGRLLLYILYYFVLPKKSTGTRTEPVVKKQ